MTKKERIKELEREVVELKNKVAALESQPTWIPQPFIQGGDTYPYRDQEVWCGGGTEAAKSGA
jgi:hypothetical protein